jgi:DNA-3-methyladenine glycosylase
MVLAREFFARPATVVAPELLGSVLAHDSPDGLVAAVIVETEAYMGLADPASHAFRGETARNEVMFGPPGHAYVYFTYGMHFCVNLVCLPPGEASAVLLRAGRVIEGVPLAAARRAVRRPPSAAVSDGAAAEGAGPGADGRRAASRVPAGRDLARGPGRLCQALGITRSSNGADVCSAASPLRVTAGAAPWPASGATISMGPRVGISRAAEWPWRFWITGEPSVSAYRPYLARRGGGKRVSG